MFWRFSSFLILSFFCSLSKGFVVFIMNFKFVWKSLKLMSNNFKESLSNLNIINFEMNLAHMEYRSCKYFVLMQVVCELLLIKLLR